MFCFFYLIFCWEGAISYLLDFLFSSNQYLEFKFHGIFLANSNGRKLEIGCKIHSILKLDNYFFFYFLIFCFLVYEFALFFYYPPFSYFLFLIFA